MHTRRKHSVTSNVQKEVENGFFRESIPLFYKNVATYTISLKQIRAILLSEHTHIYLRDFGALDARGLVAQV